MYGKFIAWILGILVAVVIAVVCWNGGMENFVYKRIVIQPDPTPPFPQTMQAYGFAPLPNSRNLDMWVRGARRKSDTLVVFFHGNAGNVVNHVLFWGNDDCPSGYDLVLFDYSGFGASPQPPRATATSWYSQHIADSLYATRVALHSYGGHKKRVVLVGHSLGGHFATHAACTFPWTEFRDVKHVDLVLGNTFADVRTVFPRLHFLASLVLRDPTFLATDTLLRSLSSSRNIRVSILHQAGDELILLEDHATRNWAAIPPTMRGVFITCTDGGHCDMHFDSLLKQSFTSTDL